MPSPAVNLDHCAEVYVVCYVARGKEGRHVECVFPNATLAWDHVDHMNAQRETYGQTGLYTVEPTKIFNRSIHRP